MRPVLKFSGIVLVLSLLFLSTYFALAESAPSKPEVSGIPACSAGSYSATIGWTGEPSADPEFDYFVDISTDSSFGSVFYNKKITNGCTDCSTVTNGFTKYDPATNIFSSDAMPALQPNTTYYVRVASGAWGHPIHSPVETFSVPRCAAQVTTRAAYEITPTGAIMNANINPSGYSTKLWFEYGSTRNLGTATESKVIGGTGARDQGYRLSNLNPGTTYYFRAVVETSVGKLEGEILSFQTGSYAGVVSDLKVNYKDDAVTIESGRTVLVSWTSSGATSCRVSPNNWTGLSGSRTSAGLTSTTTFTLECTGQGGTTRDSVTVNIGSAEPGPVAQGTLKANDQENSISVDSGTDVKISWDASGVRTCRVAPWNWSGISGSRRTNLTENTNVSLSCSGDNGNVSKSLNITVRPRTGGTTPTPTSTKPAEDPTPPPPADTYPEEPPSTNKPSKPLGQRPYVQTLSPSDISQNYVTVLGVVNPGGSRTSVWFEYGETKSLGLATPASDAGSRKSSQLISAEIKTKRDNEYYYRIAASNAFGVSRGEIKKISTTGQPYLVVEPAFQSVEKGKDGQFRAFYDFDGAGAAPKKEVTNEVTWVSAETRIAVHRLTGIFDAKTPGRTLIEAVYSADGPVYNVADLKNIRGEGSLVVTGEAESNVIKLSGPSSTATTTPPTSWLNRFWILIISILLGILLFGGIAFFFLRKRRD